MSKAKTRKNSNSLLQKYWSKISSLRTADKFFKVFGSNEPWGGHHYRINRVAKEETIVGFEKKYKIKLSPEYSVFIAEIGNGGMGPAYGLIPLLKSVKGIRKNKVGLKFSATKEVAASLMETNKAELASGKQDWELSTCDIEASGYINLATYGDGEYAILVLTGDQKGKVWYRYEKRARPLFTVKGASTKQMTFAEWYHQWLDESLKKVSVA